MEKWSQLVSSHGNYKDLRRAVQESDEDRILLHLRAGVNPNDQPIDTNPLFDAIRAGQLQSVKVLIRNGADPRVKEVATGMSAGEVALHEGQDDIAEYINMMLRYM